MLFILLAAIGLLSNVSRCRDSGSGIKPNPITIADAASSTGNCKFVGAKWDNNKHRVTEAAKYVIYAILSNNAYKRSGDEMFCLPKEWQPNGEFTVDGSGLALRVFEKLSDGKPEEVVIAFRGTDDHRDWAQNTLSAHIFPKLTQLRRAEEEFDKISGRYNQLGFKPKIVTTGHSLGGGLALHMSWVKPGVTAIAFNSSPREQAGRRRNQQVNTRVVIWERNEALEIPRKIRERLSILLNAPDHRENIDFDFAMGSSNPIQQHSMYALAKNLLILAGAPESPERKSVQPLLELNCPLNCH